MAKAKQHGWKGKIPWSPPRKAPAHWDPEDPWYPEGGIFKGGMLTFEDYNCEMVDNFEFEDTLEFESCSRGRSSATFVFKRSNGEMVSFFMNETARLFPYFTDGKVTGRFTFVKRGANYSCSIIDPSETD